MREDMCWHNIEPMDQSEDFILCCSNVFHFMDNFGISFHICTYLMYVNFFFTIPHWLNSLRILCLCCDGGSIPG